MLIKTNCLSQLLKVRSDESNFQLVSPTNQQTNLTWELLVKKGFLSNWKYKQRCKYSLMNRCIVSRSAIFWKTSSCAPSNRQREQKCMKSFCKLQSLPYYTQLLLQNIPHFYNARVQFLLKGKLESPICWLIFHPPSLFHSLLIVNIFSAENVVFAISLQE